MRDNLIWCMINGMISHLKGAVLLKSDQFVVIDVSGVGYKVYLSIATLHEISKGQSDEVSLWTHLAVRENALDLYGFITQAEVELFEMLIGISGVGPKSALAIMNVATIDALKTAIASGDTAYLTKVSGIGRKIAEKIILELRDKLGALDNEAGSTLLREETDVVDALTALGYSSIEARDALKSISTQITGTSERIKEALKTLGSGN
ncbi:MAG TPA: Holliday junction branch migration protein RuvA [Candidatus Yonathbacteria bacterium]|nr:Holliday junction branch migration protein RuvA [Candidatus Yonathbacteria bacterium]